MSKDRPSALTALSQALRDLESSATDAVVPGELHPWCEHLANHLERSREVWPEYADEERALRRQILHDDLELGHRVDGLAKSFASLDEGLSALHRRARGLLELDLLRPAASDEPTNRAQELRRRTLQWILDVRAYHAEAGTFLLEAVHRDRGIVD